MSNAGLLVLPYLGELLGGVGEVSGHLGVAIFLLAFTGQQAEDLFPHLGVADAAPGHHLAGDALALAAHGQQGGERR